MHVHVFHFKNGKGEKQLRYKLHSYSSIYSVCNTRDKITSFSIEMHNIFWKVITECVLYCIVGGGSRLVILLTYSIQYKLGYYLPELVMMPVTLHFAPVSYFYGERSYQTRATSRLASLSDISEGSSPHTDILTPYWCQWKLLFFHRIHGCSRPA